MAEQAVKFIRRNGRIIPIRASAGLIKGGQAVASAAGSAYSIKKAREPLPKSVQAINKVQSAITRKPAKIQGNAWLKYGSTALSAAEGVVSGLGIGAGTKGFAASTIGSIGLEAGTIGMAGAAYVGKGRKRERIKEAAKLEAVNQAVGWATYAGSVLGRKKGREALAGYAAKILEFGRKALRVV